MKEILNVIAHISTELHPDRVDSICKSLVSSNEREIIAIFKDSLGNSSGTILNDLQLALKKNPNVTPKELGVMLLASSYTSSVLLKELSTELVCTGPSTGFVAIRRTAQVLIDLIDQATSQLFLVSFVAYEVDNILQALKRAREREVEIRILLERSKDAGGRITVDSIKIMKDAVPSAHFYYWDLNQSAVETKGASVHAKCAVADSKVAFITSANLSEAAMERNIEMGVLIKGGSTPQQLEKHLLGLITIKQIKEII